MRVPVVYLPQAEDDIDAAYRNYEQHLAGLGDRFLEALRDRIDYIGDNPKAYGVFRRDIRAAPLRKFPHIVFYRARTTDILVVAVQHGSRSTRGWRGRV
jgi:plasmid stabilization system protein ParE